MKGQSPIYSCFWLLLLCLPSGLLITYLCTSVVLKKSFHHETGLRHKNTQAFLHFFSVFFSLFESYFVSSSGCSQTPTQPFLSCSLLCLDCGACGEGEALAFFILISGFFIMSDFSHVFCFISAGLHTTKWKRTGKKKRNQISLCVCVLQSMKISIHATPCPPTLRKSLN